MLKNMTPRERKISLDYSLVFDDGRGNGFGFPCDEAGNVVKTLNPAALENLEFCKKHPERFERFNEVVCSKTAYTEPASGDCICGERVYLEDQYYGACECPNCGRWYNLFGQSLLPPDKWDRDPSEEEYY